MKLIQIDNTLYIVEGENKHKVAEESIEKLMNEAINIVRNKHGFFASFDLFQETPSMDITDIKHRIQIRDVTDWIEGDIEVKPINVRRAFLLPEKEEPKVLIPDFNSPRNWTEDYQLENGNYTCFCRICNNTFIGYKRRVICKVCSNKEDKLDDSLNIVLDNKHEMQELGEKFNIQKLYSIEQIKSAINQVVLEGYQIEILEREIINNLTK